jgi:hypothetical protein
MKNAFSQEEILNRYDSLPVQVKDAIFAQATAEKMSAIGKKHGLLIDAIGTIATVTGYVMVGLLNPQSFTARLAEELGIPALKAREIAEDINEQVFKPIREHMLKIHDMPAEADVAQIPKAPTPPASFAQAPTAPTVAPMIFPEKLRSAQPLQSPAPAQQQVMPPIIQTQKPETPTIVPTPAPPQNQTLGGMMKPTFAEPIKSRPIPPAPSPTQNNDPYREPVN